ncbi:MAG: hypothetical protein AAFS10_03680, partial [Myxococcota bacterium]
MSTLRLLLWVGLFVFMGLGGCSDDAAPTDNNGGIDAATCQSDADCGQGEVCERMRCVLRPGVTTGDVGSMSDVSDVDSPEDTPLTDTPVVPGDLDEDGIPDPEDNCVRQPNASQLDQDLDGVGDACDPCEQQADYPAAD